MTKMNMTAAFRVQAALAGKPRKFAINAYNGGELSVSGFDLPIIVDLQGLEITASSIPILIDHKEDTEHTLGSTTSVNNDGFTLSLSGLVTGVSVPVQDVLKASDNGQQWQASIGAEVLEVEEVPDGKTVTANGQTFVGPVLIARKSVLRETSVLPSGADATTTVNLAAKAKGKPMNKFHAYLEGLGLSFDKLDDTQLASLQLGYEATLTTADAAADAATTPATPAATAPAATAPATVATSVAARRKEEADEDRRIVAVRAKAKGFPEISATAIEQGWSEEKTELAVLRASDRRTRPTAFRSEENAVPSGRRLQAAFALSRGSKIAEKAFTPAELQAAQAQYRHGMSIQQLFVEGAKASGYDLGSNRITQQNIGNLMQACLRADRPDDETTEELRAAARQGRPAMLKAGGYTTVYLPLLMENTMQLEVLESYKAAASTWQNLCPSPKSNTDFKVVPAGVRRLSDFGYKKLPADGRIEHAKFSEEKGFTRQIETSAIMTQLTRKDLIDDNNDAFAAISTYLGEGAATSLEYEFFTELNAILNDAAEFTVAKRNRITGPTSALALDGAALTQAVILVEKARSPVKDGSKILDIAYGADAPSIIVTAGGQQGITADKIYSQSQFSNGGPTLIDNDHVGKYRHIKCLLLDDVAVAGGSATRWLLLRNPAKYPILNVSFLNGVQSPTIEMADSDFNTLGVQWRGFMDWGIDKADTRYAGVVANGV